MTDSLLDHVNDLIAELGIQIEAAKDAGDYKVVNHLSSKSYALMQTRTIIEEWEANE